jgi:hypothetical protein
MRPGCGSFSGILIISGGIGGVASTWLFSAAAVGTAAGESAYRLGVSGVAVRWRQSAGGGWQRPARWPVSVIVKRLAAMAAGGVACRHRLAGENNRLSTSLADREGPRRHASGVAAACWLGENAGGCTASSLIVSK